MSARQVPGRHEGRRGETRGGRVSRGRPFRRTILVYCEGRETEPNYFRSLRAEDHVTLKFDVTVKRGKGGSRLQIIQGAVNHLANTPKSYDEKYVILDTERLDTPEARKDFDNAIRLARQNGFHPHLSNPSFEVWFLAHFVRTCRYFKHADAVVAELNKHWIKAFDSSYCKTDESTYLKLRARTSDAIKHARQVREEDHKEKDTIIICNSATEVYLLVEYLVSK
jgi:hypothetical protein